jgi:DNA (cytosine-5)-methyltransferase 1
MDEVRPLTLGSLFAGIGGLDLGLERAGMVVKWQVEIDEYCRRVLAKHWPDVKRHEDVNLCGSREWVDSILSQVRWDQPPPRLRVLEPVDVICGGFPCQDISSAHTADGKAGIEGEQSGLWREFARIVRWLRPRYVVVENVSALLYSSGGFGTVLGDLATYGYDAEWEVLPAAALGAPHQRARVWLVAYPYRHRKSDSAIDAKAQILSGSRPHIREWPDPPRDLRMDDGLPSRLDRLRILGNSVNPDCASYIGSAVVRHYENQEV